MHPKAKLDTTSLKYSTNSTLKQNNTSPLETPVQFVKGVGPRLSLAFQSRGIETVKDLLFFFPRAYEDRNKVNQVTDLSEGQIATISVRIQSSKKVPLRTGKILFEARCSDPSGNPLYLKWFHLPRGMDKRFIPQTLITVSGTIKTYQGRVEIIHPEISWNAIPSSSALQTQTSLSSAPSNDASLEIDKKSDVTPIYTEIEGISSRVLRKILWEAIEKYSAHLNEDLSQTIRNRHQLPSLANAVKEIHFPEKLSTELIEFNTPFHWRLIYEEFFKFELLVLKQRLKMEKHLAAIYGTIEGKKAIDSLQKTLPFDLTSGQKNAIEEIVEDLSSPHPMNRLIQGDVGSGKTAVGFLTACCVLAQGSQAALMAPTEILAEQHYKNAIKLFGGRLNVALLTGKTPTSERTHLFKRLISPEPILLIGTHALIEEPVQFNDLGLIMIDEQHRFGVEQRRTLRNKGIRKNPITQELLFPHTLIFTATPIPRTLALTAYGDLSVSTIKELPPGRSPITTKIIRTAPEKQQVYQKIHSELTQGRQAYFIYPLVKESEAEGFTELKAAVKEAEILQKEIFPQFQVGLLHGQQKADEKAKIMEDFKQNKIQILVSTTVVEVGVDVPNATVMVIEHSERFGLSQLHQLRGRVGRGNYSSFCFLFSHQKAGESNSSIRLEVLEETNDGFKIAEADLEIRGPGEFLGVRQSGGLPFRLAHLVRDREWLIKARDDAMKLLREDPDLLTSENQPLRNYFIREGQIQFERLKTS